MKLNKILEGWTYQNGFWKFGNEGAMLGVAQTNGKWVSKVLVKSSRNGDIDVETKIPWESKEKAMTEAIGILHSVEGKFFIGRN